MWSTILLSALAGLIIGLNIGIISSTLAHNRKKDQEAVGSLRVDHSFKDELPSLYLELNRGVETFINEPYVLLKVRREDFFPQ